MIATLPRPAAVPSPPQARRSPRERAALAALLVGAAVLYLWNLSVNGWANDYYSAAVRSMTVSWKAFFFASFDAGGTVTVDKPPASLWVMALSGRLFGFSSWSMLVPQALMAVATVALLYAAVRRVSGPGAGLLAGAVLALTPVAVLMFRFNNPDALLVLLMVAAAYATVRAIERAGTRWLLLAGLLIGFAFLTKMAQAFVVLPALALAYLVTAPTGFWRRIRQLLGAAAAVVAGAGWWVAIVELWPAADRPYIGGSTTNSVLELALGYNGLGRIFGQGRGSGSTAGTGFPGGTPPAGAEFGGAPPAGAEFAGPGGGGFGGSSGLGRLFAGEIGGQVTWLLPAALLLFVVALWLLRRAPRTDVMRASVILWGGWTVVTFLVFSLAEGIFHPYYTVALAPGIAALAGLGGHVLWQLRHTWLARGTLAVAAAGTGAWAFVLLERSPEFLPWLCWVMLVAAVLGAAALLVPARVAGTVALVLSVAAGLAGPAAYAVQTVATSHTGSIPAAGPQVAGQQGGPGMRDAASPGAGTSQAGANASGQPGTGTGTASATGAGATQPGTGQRRGFGGPDAGRTTDPALVAALRAAVTDWSAATVGSQSAAGLALAGDTDVMAIGGFSGGDPAPTLEQFQALVSQGRVHYFVEGGGPGGGSRDRGNEIGTWVQQTFTATTVGGVTVYDLTEPR